MGGLDLFDELERMALNASEHADLLSDEEPSAEKVARWQRLFYYSPTEAVNQIKQQRGDVNRARVSEEHWRCIQLRKEAEGYDREAYEHQLRLDLGKSPHPPSCTAASGQENDTANYLFKLAPPLDSPSAIQIALDLPTLPTLRRGEGSYGIELFCEVESSTKHAISSFFSIPATQPCFRRSSEYRKPPSLSLRSPPTHL